MSHMRERASSEAKQAGKEGLAGILMAPGPSSWARSAMVSRSPVHADRFMGIDFDLRAAVASNGGDTAARDRAQHVGRSLPHHGSQGYQSTI